jgi:hypothetical protein
MNMHSQATQDQEIHRRAIEKGAFDAFGTKFLINDMGTKERFKEFLKKARKGGKIEDGEKRELIALLHKDQEGHRGYLARQDFNPTTGSAEWHQMWIDTYDKWISWLNQIGTNY